MKLSILKNLNFWVFVLLPSLILADSWYQTDWSGGSGYSQWQNPTGYYEGSGVNGWRAPGVLTLFAPNFAHFNSIGKLPDAIGVYALYSDSLNHYYAGSGNTYAGSGRLFISTDFGNSWDTTSVVSNAVYKIQSILLPSFGEIFIGTDPERIYSSNQMGDSVWDLRYNINNAKGTFISSILETENCYLYASGVSSVNNQGKIHRGINYGVNWGVLPDTLQPRINGVAPAAIYQFILTEDSCFYVSTYFTNLGARIFRFPSNGQMWELCGNLPDTFSIPFAMDIGYDTLGGYGIIYVGTGEGTGKVFRSTNAGNSWETCGTLEGAYSVNEIKIDADGTVYAAVNTNIGLIFGVKVFRSTNMGLTWDTTGSLGGDITNKPTSFYQTKQGFLLVGTEDEAEIFKSAYFDSGYLNSSIYDVGTRNGSSKFGIINWVCNLNGQHLKVKVRTAMDSSMTGALSWSQCPEAINGDTISKLISVNNGDRYMQYRIKLSTDSIDFSPEFKEIQIDYTIDTIPPHLDTAYASDGDSIKPGIDKDDYVILIFDDFTNMPQINPDSIDSILRLNGGHSWLDDSAFAFANWIAPETLKISWPGLAGSPTVAVGDTIYPDTQTITDVPWGNPCFNQIVLTGSFGPSGVTGSDLSSKVIEGATVYPSISQGKAQIQLNIKRDSDVEVNIFDITGRRVEHIVDKRFSKGIYSLNWHNKGLPQGLYFIRANINGHFYITKVVLFR